MADEYIKREDAIAKPFRFYWRNGVLSNPVVSVRTIKELPVADVVPVVRCGECVNWHRCLSDDGSVEYFNFSHCEKGHNGFPTFYCADGERKEQDDD